MATVAGRFSQGLPTNYFFLVRALRALGADYTSEAAPKNLKQTKYLLGKVQLVPYVCARSSFFQPFIPYDNTTF
jgi:hypothetical protein